MKKKSPRTYATSFLFSSGYFFREYKIYLNKKKVLIKKMFDKLYKKKYTRVEK